MSNDVVACVGAIIHDRLGRLLLIQRGHEPGLGLWSIPGGRIERGETDHQAIHREIAEECGLQVRAVRLAGRVQRTGPGGVVYDIADYLCEVLGTEELTPGTDADDARWVDSRDYSRLPLVEGLTEALSFWNLMPTI